jgi:chromosome condensin MukBEF complex kleisin-like MukF subunit
VFSPLIYGLVNPDLNYFLSIIIFAPLFYFIIEFIDRITPNPRAIEEGQTSSKESFIPPKF